MREKISHLDSPEYALHREAKINDREAGMVFGGFTIRELDRMQDTLSAEEMIRFRKDAGEPNLYREWLRLFQSRPQESLDLLSEVLSDSEELFECLDVLKIPHEGEPKKSMVEEIHAALISAPDLIRSFPADFLERLTRTHIDRHRERQEQFEKDGLPKLMSDVDTHVLAAMKRGVIPVSQERWKRIKEQTPISLSDPINKNDLSGDPGHFKLSRSGAAPNDSNA